MADNRVPTASGTDATGLAGEKRSFARWLIEPMQRNRGVYVKVMVAAVMINILGLVTALFTMTVYDRVVPNNAIDSLIALSIGLAIVIIFDFILRVLRAYFVDVAGADIDHEVGEAAFRRLLAVQLDAKRGSTGGLASLMRELETLRDFFASATLVAVVDVPFIALTLLFTALLGGWVVIVPLLMVPLVIISGLAARPALDRLSGQAMNEGMLKQAVLVEAIGGLEMVKATGAQPLLTERWRASMNSHSHFSLQQRLISTLATSVATSANSIAYAGIVIVGVFLIADGSITMGALIACSILGGRALQPLGQVAQILSRLGATRSAYDQLDGLMQLPSEEDGGERLRPAAITGRIEFRGVHFAYPGANEPALSGVDLTIEPGQRIALIGKVGSGKSTFARLISGLYAPQDGSVMIDNCDVRQYAPEALRAHIGICLQDTSLLSGTVRENILLARPHIDDEEMLRAASLSGTHSFMGALANGYDLRLADRGEGLSGGQRQSIALARALAGRPAIVILDEPTSGMDSMTEAQLIQRLDEETRGRTVVIITHRPALLRLADRIVLMDSGKVAAHGPRDEMLKRLMQQKAA